MMQVVYDLLDLTYSEQGLMDSSYPEVRADVKAAHVLAAHRPTPRVVCPV